MKPTKNLYYCCDCGKTKMLFSTEKKALNFIRLNAEEIAARNADGKAPVRAYFCVACGGWHTTSSLEPPTHSSRVEVYLRSLTKGSLKEVHDSMTRKLLKHDEALRQQAEMQRQQAAQRAEAQRLKAKQQARKQRLQRLQEEQQRQAALAQATYEYKQALAHYDLVNAYLQQMALCDACRELVNGIKRLRDILHPAYRQLCSDKMSYGYRLLAVCLEQWCQGIVGRINAGSLDVAEEYLDEYRRTIHKLYNRNIREVAAICDSHWVNYTELEKKIALSRQYRQTRWA